MISPVSNSLNRLSRPVVVSAVLVCSLVLAACGGGGGADPVIVADDGDCKRLIEKGFNSDRAVGADGVQEGQGGDGSGGGGDGGAGEGIGAGGALGQFRNVKVIARNPTDGSVIAEGETDTEMGMATVRLCSYAGPLELEFRGQPGAEYYDEAKKAFVPFPADQAIRVRTPDVTRSFIGATPYTEAAVRLDQSQLVNKAASASLARDGSPAIRTKAVVAKSISEANDRVASILADQLPGIYRASGDNDRFDITGLPIALNDQNASVGSTLPDTNRGRYSAANAALSELAGTFLPEDPTPSITIAEQLARDLGDGKLDLVDVDGCSVDGAPGCEGEAGRPLAYSYETLWRAKTIATGLTTEQAGDESLRAKAAPVAEFSSTLQKVYKTQGCQPECEAFITRTDAGQIVRLNHRGELRVVRSISAGFGPSINWLIESEIAGQLDGTFVEVKVGSRGEVVALLQNRRGLLYLPPISLYEVTGLEGNAAQARDALRQSVSSFAPVQIDFEPGRVMNFTIAPRDRELAQGNLPDLLVTRSDGRIEAIGIDANRRVQRREQPFPLPAVNVVYDKLIPPGFDPAYGPAGTSLGTRPWFGPRRIYGLTRRGQVRVLLEGNAGANGVELAVPGRVVQLAAESRVGVYALNSDGGVYWINADQAGHDLHTVFAVTIPEKVCWIARQEAVACGTGTVYRWEEVLDELFFRQPDAPANSPQDLTYGLKSIGSGQAVDLGASATPIWRLNSVQEFTVKSRRTGSIDTRGIRYLAVTGADAIDPEALTRGARNLQISRCRFPGLTSPSPYLNGWQVRRAFKSAQIGLGQSPLRIRSSGSEVSVPSGRAAPGPTDVYSFVIGGNPWSGPGLLAPGQSPDENACDASGNQAREINIREPGPLSNEGFSLTPFEQRSVVQAVTDAGAPVQAREIPVVALSGTLGEKGDEFFIDLDRVAVTGEGNTFERSPDNTILVLNNNDRYPLDRTLRAWARSYYVPADEPKPDPLADVFDPPPGFDPNAPCRDAGACTFIKLIPQAVFGDPYSFRLCYSQNARTNYHSIGRLTCTTHDFSGNLIGGTGLETWVYPKPNDGIRNLIDFQHLYDGSG